MDLFQIIEQNDLELLKKYRPTLEELKARDQEGWTAFLRSFQDSKKEELQNYLLENKLFLPSLNDIVSISKAKENEKEKEVQNEKKKKQQKQKKKTGGTYLDEARYSVYIPNKLNYNLLNTSLKEGISQKIVSKLKTMGFNLNDSINNESLFGFTTLHLAILDGVSIESLQSTFEQEFANFKTSVFQRDTRGRIYWTPDLLSTYLMRNKIGKEELDCEAMKVLYSLEKQRLHKTKKELKKEIGVISTQTGRNMISLYAIQPVHYAVSNGCGVKILKQLKEFGLDLAKADSGGNNALHYACNYQSVQVETLQFLIANGCDLNQVNKLKVLPLHFACYSNCSLGVLKYLLEHTKDPNVKTSQNLKKISKYYNYSKMKQEKLDNSTCLHYLLSNGSRLTMEKVKLFLENEKFQIDNNFKNYKGENCLYIGCKNGISIEILKFLIEKGLDDIKQVLPKRGNNLLLLICSKNCGLIKNKLQMINFLLSRGLNYKIKNNEEKNVLHLLIEKGLYLGDENTGDSRAGKEQEEQNMQLIKLLINKGVDPDDQDINGFTPLSYACKNFYNLNIIKLLITEFNINIGLNNQTPLTLYLKNIINNRNSKEKEKKYNGIKFLINSGSEINILDQKNKNNLLHLAILSKSSYSVIQKLIKLGANINHTNNNNETPIHLFLDINNYQNNNDNQGTATTTNTKISSNNNDDDNDDDESIQGNYSRSYSMTNEEIYQIFLLLASHLNINVYSTKNKCRKGNGKTFRYLDKRSINLHYRTFSYVNRNFEKELFNPHLKDEESKENQQKENPNKPNIGELPLHLICKNFKNKPDLQLKLIKEILNRNPKLINTRDMNSETPLHLLCSYPLGDFETIQYLIKKGADINAKNDDNSIPLHLASQYRVFTKLGYQKLRNEFLFINNNQEKFFNQDNKKRAEHYKIVKCLIECGSDINCLNSKIDLPLHFACRGDTSVEVVDLLISKININVLSKFDDGRKRTDQRNYWYNRTQDEKSLITGLSRIQPDVDKGFSPLHLACYHCTDNRVIKLLIDKGADLGVLDQYLETPLFDSISRNNEGATLLLLNNKKESLNCNQRNNEGETILHLGLKMGISIKIIKLILKRGINLFIRDRHDNTILHTLFRTEFGKNSSWYEYYTHYNFTKYQFEICKLILKSEHNLINLKSDFDQSDSAFSIEITREELRKVETRRKHLDRLHEESLLNSELTFTQIQRQQQIEDEDEEFTNSQLTILKDGIGPTAMQLALRYNVNHKIIQLLIENNCDLNLTDFQGKSVLHYAVYYLIDLDSIPLIFDILKEQKVNINQIDKLGRTPLHYLFLKKKSKFKNYDQNIKYTLNLINLFCQYGANINYTDNFDETPLHYAFKLNVPFPIINQLINKGADPSLQNNVGITSFHLFFKIKYINFNQFELLVKSVCLNKNKNNLVLENNEGTTIEDLIYKLLRKYPEFWKLDLIKLIIKSGFNILKEFQFFRNESNNLLFLALRQCFDLDIINYLIKKQLELTKNKKKTGNVENEEKGKEKEKEKETETEKDKETEKDNKKNDNIFKDDINNNGENALHLICSKPIFNTFIEKKQLKNIQKNWGKIKIIKLEIIKLILKYNPDINIMKISCEGKAPIHYACENNLGLEIIKFLVGNGSLVSFDLNNKKFRDLILQPIHSAMYSKPLNFDIINYLIEKGADINSEDFHEKTPLYQALLNGCTLEEIKFLVKKGSKINVRPKSRKIPLKVAIRLYFNLKIINFLIDQGANTKFLDSHKNTLIHFAARYSQPMLINILVKNGVDINALNDKNLSALHLIVRFPECDYDTVKALVDNGADVNLQHDICYSTPLHYATKKNNKRILNLLLQKNPNWGLFDETFKTPIELISLHENSNEIIPRILNSNPDIANFVVQKCLTICKEKIETQKYFLQFNNLQKIFEQFLIRQELADLINVENNIKIHSFIFKMRFGNDLDYNKIFKKICKIKDKNLIQKLLLYVYTGNILFEVPVYEDKRKVSNFLLTQYAQYYLRMHETSISNFEKLKRNKYKEENEIFQLLVNLGLIKNNFKNFRYTIGRNALIHDLSKMLNNAESMNFTMFVDNKPIKLHKEILIIRSDLYRNMFISINDETNEIKDFSGISYKAMKVLIHFFYTESISKDIQLSIIDELLDRIDYFQLNENTSFEEKLKEKTMDLLKKK
ncbi:ankyrin repeat ph and sec7 domain containing protein secg-related [Anaeramoeba flamelloides]|uniref:Ankyrin repeat ph and sec7 domain containing protein secg-related n=1 Tax=Anaeramoeba flamelloides TaxID=1746091 RepID=A0AAV7ZFD5_9EUKA|nr:ankyrin repeat ph and sec7 domain containing protein secg-related [Anaeramoeba flamelloides]